MKEKVVDALGSPTMVDTARETNKNEHAQRASNKRHRRKKQAEAARGCADSNLYFFFFFCPENAENWNAEPKRGRKNSNRPLGDAESWQQCRSRNDRGDERFTNLEHREAGGI